MSFELRRQTASDFRGKQYQVRSGSCLLYFLQVNEGFPVLVVRIKLREDESLFEISFAFEALESVLVYRFIAPEVSDGV